MHKANLEMAHELKCRIAGGGMAWLRTWEKDPKLDLHYTDRASQSQRLLPQRLRDLRGADGSQPAGARSFWAERVRRGVPAGRGVRAGERRPRGGSAVVNRLACEPLQPLPTLRVADPSLTSRAATLSLQVVGNAFTILWSAEQCRHVRSLEGSALRFLWGGHNQDTRYSRHRIGPGDIIYPIQYQEHSLYLLARVVVGEAMTVSAYLGLCSDDSWIITHRCANEVLVAAASTPLSFAR